MKKFLAVIFTCAVIFALASCGGCKSHVDADDDLKCDNCGAEFDDGSYGSGIQSEGVTIRLTFEDGSPVANTQFTITRGTASYNLTTNSQGSVFRVLELGTYSVTYGTLPENYDAESFSFTVEKGTTDITLRIVDATVYGTLENPFIITEDTTYFDIEAGAEQYYSYRHSEQMSVLLYHPDIQVNYQGNIYSYSGGNVKVAITPDENGTTLFSIKNTSDEAISSVMFMEAPTGSFKNPWDMVGNSQMVFMDSGEQLYYKWTASEGGILTLSVDNKNCVGSLIKVVDGEAVLTENTDDTGKAYITVESGESIIIGLSVPEDAAFSMINFSLAIADE